MLPQATEAESHSEVTGHEHLPGCQLAFVQLCLSHCPYGLYNESSQGCTN